MSGHDLNPGQNTGLAVAAPGRTPGPVFMMDLLAIVPYYTAYLARALKAEGAPVVVGSISYYLDPTCFSSRGLQPRPGLLDLVGRFPALPARVRQVAKLLETSINMLALSVAFLFRRPAVVHVQYLPMLRLGLPLERWFLKLCRRLNIPLVLTVHDLLPHDTAERYRAVFQELYASVDRLICHSAHVRDRLVEEFSIPAGSIAVIPHGPFFYDLPQPRPAENAGREEPGELTVLWQGILFPYKGVDVLLEAWAEVQGRVPHAHLCVLGTGSAELREQFEQQAQQFGLRNLKLDFRFVSAEDLVSAYRSADLVVYPYRAITTSGALATGLALGKAIVASDLPVFREVLRDGESALLCPPGDAFALAEALIRALESPDLRARMAGNVAAMQFGDSSWKSIARATLATYAAASAQITKRKDGQERQQAHG